MSKTFDEGGAKGLLLVNLGVGEHGCNIVFDSSHHNDDKEEEDHPTTTTLRETDDEGPSPEPPEQALRLAEGMVDISNWTAKLESLLNTEYNGDSDDDDSQAAGSSNAIRTLPLVPQLDALRAEHDALEAGGFIDDSAVALAATVGPKTPGKRRYQADDQEEQKADYSIHQEAKERSVLHQQQPMSGARRVLLDSPDDDGTPHQPTSHSGDCEENGSVVDFGNGYDDGNDDDDDDAFDMYIATTASRFSDAGLDDLGPTPNNNCSTTSLLREGESSSAAQLIDAIASGATVLSGSDYEYFSVAPFINNTTVSLGFDSHTNQWAGAAHWKRSVVQSKVDQLAARNLKKKSSKPKNIPAKKKKRAPNLDIALHDAVDLSHLFVTDPMKNKKNTKSQQAQPKKSSSSFTLSQTMITKLTNQENLLPIDAGLQSLEQLTKPFLLPNFVLHQNRGEPVTEFANATTIEQRGHDKTVSFHVPDWEGDDGSCGDDNDGPGFDFGGNDDEDDEDDFQVMDLEGVRKVAKVRVGYATVAKKVDVKRLKRDLWNKLETTITSKVAADPDQGHEGSLSQPTKAKDVAISFRETVQELEQQQAQTDITISFYFICILHLANEKGLLLEQQPSKNCDGNLSLDNFSIHFPSTSAVFPMSMPP